MFKQFTYIILVQLFILLFYQNPVYGFCGFYVAKADASLYNQASKVVIVRHEDKTVISMMNDYKGELKDFALVVPVPVILEKDQINIGDPKIFDHIDAYSAPRLVEYFDSDPCNRRKYKDYFKKGKVMESSTAEAGVKQPSSLGVQVEASYTVGEYDIQILSAKFSDGLETWLIQNGYKMPKGTKEALKPYIMQNMKFFVAKVNLEEQSNTKLSYLRPLQFAFESPKFMLPIRLGLINSNGDQDLLVYALTRNGRVESSNYRTVKLPSNIELPRFVKSEFADFYKDMFTKTLQKENNKVIITEYFWNMGWCDPCAADPLSVSELKSLGVMWLDPQSNSVSDVMVSRLHVRYNKDTFPEDLFFTETGDKSNFQGRYIIRHPWTGSRNSCSEADAYFQSFRKAEEQRATNLASLTGWSIDMIRKKMDLNTPSNTEENTKWWKKIWK